MAKAFRLIAGVFALVLAPPLIAAEPAFASTTTVTITNLAQSGAPSSLAQPPVAASARGTCESVYASDGTDCPAGTWPQAGSEWGPVVHVAGGDRLQLHFDDAVSAVDVSVVTNYPEGLTDPAGQPVSNQDIMPPTSANPTDDPATWEVVLPTLDHRADSGLAFAIVAMGESGSVDFSASIRTPRWVDESMDCGTAYYDAGESTYLCPNSAIPPGVPGGGSDSSLLPAPRLTLGAGGIHRRHELSP